jgi:ATP-dependent DNA helicase PIF1
MVKGSIITAGEFYGKEVIIPRIKLSPSEAELPFRMMRLQLPIRLAFAVTINKSQCQTLRKAALYLPTDIFTHGQLYVALSHVSEGARGIVVMSTKQMNIVYREVFE